MMKSKKYVFIVLIMVMIGITLKIDAYNDPTAGIHELSSRVSISGMLDSTKAGERITMLLIKRNANLSLIQNSDIGHIDQTTINNDGSYGFKIKFTGNINDYQVMVNQEGEIVTPSITNAVATPDLVKVDLDLSANTTLATAVVEIDNLYGIETMTYKMVLAFYSEEGKLLGVKLTDKKSIQNNITNDQLLENVPEQTKTIKAYIWDSTEKMIPLCKTETLDTTNLSTATPTPTPTPTPEPLTYKVLAIGNSFSEDASEYVHQIAEADGVTLKIVNLYVAGCSLQTHWNNANSNSKVYDSQLNGGSSSGKVSISEALDSDSWDFVTIQQASPDSGKESTYSPYIENLSKYVKEIEPNAVLFIHQTWAYEKGSNHSGFPYYDSDQTVMFNALKSAYDIAAVNVGLLTLADGTDVSSNKAPLKIIPSGKAMQNARANAIFDTTYGDGKSIKLNRDGYHASLTYGRYLLGAVWYEAITGMKIETNTYCPSGIASSEWTLLKQAAHDAVVEYGWQSE